MKLKFIQGNIVYKYWNRQHSKLIKVVVLLTKSINSIQHIQEFVVGAVLTDLSKAFDSIPHDLLIAKLEAYGLSEKALSYIYLYISQTKTNVF